MRSVNRERRANVLVDIPVKVPDHLSLDKYFGKGRQPGEEDLDLDASPSAVPEFDAVALSQLESMGFPTIRCQKALMATGSADAETAMTWLLEHMDDPGMCPALVHSSEN